MPITDHIYRRAYWTNALSRNLKAPVRKGLIEAPQNVWRRSVGLNKLKPSRGNGTPTVFLDSICGFYIVIVK